MINIDEQRQLLKEMKSKLNGAGESLDPPKLKLEIDELKAVTQREDFWQDVNNAQVVSKKLKQMENKLEHFETLTKNLASVEEFLDMAQDDLDMLEEVGAEILSIKAKVDALHLETLLKGKYDDCDATITLHAGAGGTEAMDWASMLYRMYARYAERQGFKVVEEDKLDGEEAGIKSVTFTVSGDYAYGYMKAEKGVHRLVRISPFDANKRRHTSFASLEVMPILQNDEEIVINEKDLKVDTYRSSGAGGQHVNKTESAIRITHLPTGIVVACQTQRSQIQNREYAMQMLKSKLAELKERQQMEEAMSIKGEVKKIEWGSQIRSYVFCPYTMVKDHRTGFENTNVSDVMDGNIQPFIEDYLSKAF
ncbi:MAG: peptide chain release factor 2 [Clostridia bacterium]|nr:peptide chain release factor 2 [Clostridia bacterium]